MRLLCISATDYEKISLGHDSIQNGCVRDNCGQNAEWEGNILRAVHTYVVAHYEIYCTKPEYMYMCILYILFCTMFDRNDDNILLKTLLSCRASCNVDAGPCTELPCPCDDAKLSFSSLSHAHVFL